MADAPGNDPVAMKRCATCGKQYAADYDGCPHCARVKTPGARAKDALVGCGVVVIVGLALAGFLSMCTSGSSGAASESPAIANKVQQAINAEGASSVVHDVTAQTDGEVIVTLTVTKESLGSDVQARDAGQGVAGLIFTKVPEVTQVSVFDGNNKLIGTYRPR